MSEEDLLTASRPEMMPQASSLLSAPLLADTAATPVQPAATCTLPASPESVKVSRDFTRATLRECGLLAAVLAITAVLTVLTPPNAPARSAAPARVAAPASAAQLSHRPAGYPRSG